jgi:hypothetical protein
VIAAAIPAITIIATFVLAHTIEAYVVAIIDQRGTAHLDNEVSAKQ